MPTYGKVRYADLWPGIDASFYGGQSGIEYDLRLAPDADPRHIALGFSGARDQRLDRRGALVLTLAGGRRIRQLAPVAYQFGKDGVRHVVESRFMLAHGVARVALGSYDHRRVLVIDPALAYSTYLGGSGFEQGSGVAVDSAGNAYVGGSTSSTNFPTAGPGQAANAGGTDDAFVAKLNPSGTAPVYSTYLGGNGIDATSSIAIDSSGDAYVTGSTTSSNFPTQNAKQPSNAGGDDAFVTKLNPAGNGLGYSTYLGGTGNDDSVGIVVDSGGSAYVTGTTTSTNFPTQSAEQTVCGDTGCTLGDAFVTKLTPAGDAFGYSSYLGGNNKDVASGIGIDAAGEAYVSGFTISSNFPTMSAMEPVGPGLPDGFVSKFNAAGSSLVYSTYLGGSASDAITGISVDAIGNAYITGATLSTDFPVTNAGQPSCGDAGCAKSDAFVAKLNASGSGMDYSTYLGGNGQDFGYGVTHDASGDAYVVGYTTSTDFPSVNAAQSACGDPGCSQGDAFITELSPAGRGRVYSSYLGGSNKEQAYGVAVDAAGAAYVTGFTSSSTDFPVVDAFQPTYAGGVADGFVAKFSGPDFTAPTSAAAAPVCDGPVIATVTDNHAGSGPAAVLHRIDGGLVQATPVSGSPGTAAISIPEGNHALEYWGQDVAGNQETPGHLLPVQIDTTAPTLSIVSDQGFSSYEIGDKATVTIHAADAISGLAADPSRSHVIVSTASPGHYHASTSATDRCGNSSSASFGFKVIPNPVRYRNVDVETRSGTVKLDRGRRPSALIGAAQVPLGTIVDATAGTVRVTAAGAGGPRQRGSFAGDRVKILQPRANHGLTVLSVLDAGKCAGTHGSADPRVSRARTLHALATGQFRTSGHDASATSLGPSAAWTMTDGCAGTTIRVTRGRVAVLDFGSNRTKVLRAGQEYGAPPK